MSSPRLSPVAPVAEARNHCTCSAAGARSAEPRIEAAPKSSSLGAPRRAAHTQPDADSADTSPGALTRPPPQVSNTTMKTVACALLLASAAALAPTPARTAVSKAAPKPALHYQVAAAATAFAPLAALAGGQSEGTGLSLGIDDPREGTVLWVIGGFFFATYYNWAKEQPDSDSDFFAEYDERRL